MCADSLPLVSVVTPAYNEEQHLPECIESVLRQTYTNWEYTIVNNCSTDRTLAVAESYAARDSRIHVISNGTLIPAVANFNLALRNISPVSKYVKMVFADDWMFPECLERMVAVMEQNPGVGIVGSYGLANEWVVWQGLSYPSTVTKGRDVCRQRLLGGPYVFGSATSVLLRADLVRSHDPFYNENNMQNDSESCFQLLNECDFGFVHQVLTFSRVRPQSLLQSSLDLNTAAAGILHEVVKYGPDYLSPEEYSECLTTTVSKYYDFLASAVLQRRPRKFWEYHTSKMREEGIGFSRLRLAYVVGKRIAARLSLKTNTRNQRPWGL